MNSLKLEAFYLQSPFNIETEQREKKISLDNLRFQKNPVIFSIQHGVKTPRESFQPLLLQIELICL